jgi:hypothetical protein
MGPPRAFLLDREVGIVKIQLTGKPADAPPGTIGAVVDSGVEVASGDESTVVRRVFDAGKYLPATTVLRPGDRFREPNFGDRVKSVG